MKKRPPIRALLALMALVAALATAPTMARPAPPTPANVDEGVPPSLPGLGGYSNPEHVFTPQVAARAEGDDARLRLEWPGGALAAMAPPETTTVALLLPAAGDAAPRITTLRQLPWSGDLPTPAALPEREQLDGTSYPPLAGFAPVPTPAAPISLLREGLLRGQRVGVYALSPVYAAQGTAFRVELAEALVPGARPIDTMDLARLAARPFVTDAPAPDPLAAGPAWRVTVREPGIQELGAAELAAVGLDLARIDPANLRLRQQGRNVPLELLRDGGGVLRFYAEPGDRWNATTTYWLTVDQGSGATMASRDATATDAPLLTTALERGAWRSNRILETRLPGPDGDRFFSADLRVIPPPERPDSVVATISPGLPPAGPPRLTLQGETLRSGRYTLCVRAGAQPTSPGYSPCTDGGEPERAANWSGQGPWSVEVDLPGFASEVTIALLPTSGADQVHLDGVAWELPVSLELGGRGARLIGRAGRFAYQLGGLPPAAALYDVTDPLQPVRLRFTGNTFADEAPTARVYLATGPGTLHRPTIARHTPVDLSRPLNAQALYIAPAEFLNALEPLLAHRRDQGLATSAVAVEAIYDAWSGGQVSPEAIRSFLRYAAASWTVAPTAVILVGDGSSDPRNYLGRNNRTWVPPYLATVDPWLGETACESCYARLDGADPRADALPDVWLGRLPAKSVEETAALVAKILGYERDRSLGAWRARIAYIADNTDIGGNFAATAEESIRLQPARAQIARNYYDPEAPAGDPWRERDPLLAQARTLIAFDAGAAFVHYLGHGLQFQWAYTGPPLQADAPRDRQYLLGLFEVDDLRNGGRLPVVLAMTCLSGAFQIPAFVGTSIDERLVVRAGGGAIASWSPTGLGVLYGHDALQRGFYRALWAPGGPAPLGALTLAGYLELFSGSPCCQETISTYALLGDPLTTPRVDLDARSLSLPLIGR